MHPGRRPTPGSDESSTSPRKWGALRTSTGAELITAPPPAQAPFSATDARYLSPAARHRPAGDPSSERGAEQDGALDATALITSGAASRGGAVQQRYPESGFAQPCDRPAAAGSDRRDTVSTPRSNADQIALIPCTELP